MAVENMFPSEIIDLPSQGKLYPKDSPLASGKVEMFYMTAKSEDILTNQAFIEKGVVIDKLLQHLIVDKNIDYSQLLVGDKNALLLAARILGYGKMYKFTYRGEEEEVDLSLVEAKELHPEVKKAKSNEFKFTLPVSGIEVTFKLLTHADEQAIEQELKGLRKLQKDGSFEMSTRLKYMILSVDGESDRKAVRSFVDGRFLAADARAFRKYVSELQPDVDMKFYPENGPDGGVDIPIGVQFLWPDAEL